MIVSSSKVNNYPIQTQRQAPKTKPSFKSWVDVPAAMIKFIEHGGKAVEFVVMDVAGDNVPRVIQAGNRNREELGEPNYNAFIEESIKEFTTGPSMFVIPAASLLACKKIFGAAAAGIKFPFLDKLTEAFKSIDDKSAQGLYTEVVRDAFEPHKGIDDIEKAKTDIVGKFVEMDATKDRKRIKTLAGEISGITADFNTRLAAKLGDAADSSLLSNPEGLKFRGLDVSASKLVDYTRKYASDMEKNLPKQIAKSGTPEKAIQHLHDMARGGRTLTHILALGVTTAVLWMIPRIYQQTDKFPGVNGIDGEVPQTDNVFTRALNKNRKEGV